ncbi:RNA-binding cell elongation regulator Jag/EloR [uncultured Selenomonas sp.]|uniref:RNA-binding cell elongation regulator Jag/EloR n=1 Tax=uncultured Selenomonas sp. TaxID=159275 RepID=UPI0025D78C75|nr:RNA-binding cell elongation regulator Jag/EloR [uncultured Selenomonas sp.]
MAEIIETTGKTVEDALAAALEKLGCGREEVTYEVIQEPSGGFLGLWGKREARIRVTTRPIIRPHHREIPTPPPPTITAAPREESVPARSEDDGFDPRAKRYHTDLRSSARRNAAGDGSRTETERRDAAPRRERPARDDAPRSYGNARPRYEGARGREGGYPPRPRRERSDIPLLPLTDEMAAAAEGFLGKIFAAMDLSVTLNRTDTPTGTIFNMHGENLGILIGKHGATLDALQYLTNLVVNKIPETGFARIILDVEDYRARREETLIRLAGHLADKACRIGEEIHLEPMSRHERKIIHMALQDNRRVTTYSAGDNPRRYVVIVPKRRRYGRSEDGYEAYEQ